MRLPPPGQAVSLGPRCVLLAVGSVAWLNACALLAGAGNSPVEYFASEAQQELFRGVMRQDAGRMDRALAQGADVNKIGEGGYTPLLVSIRHDRPRAMQMLLERGADPSLVSPMPEDSLLDIRTPVEMALRMRSAESLRVLLEHGADPDAPAAQVETNTRALHFAVRMREYPELTRLLIEHGADLNIRKRYGTTPLMQALYSSCFVNARILLEAGADPTLEKDGGLTVIWSIRHNHPRRSGHARAGAYDMSGYFEFIEALKERGYLEEDFE